MTLNPLTRVWEYCAGVDAKRLVDGPIEVRAVIYPKRGIPRVLAGPQDESRRAVVGGEHSLFLTGNANHTRTSAVRWVSKTGSDTTGNGTSARPYATIIAAAKDIQTRHGSADGATIYLTAGNHVYPSQSGTKTNDRWLTIASAPGATRESVRITANAGTRGLKTKLVRFKSLTISGTTIPSGGSGSLRSVWADDCILEARSPDTANTFFSHGGWAGGIYVTECTMRNVLRAAYGYKLVRNTLLTDIAGDAFRDPAGMILNCEVRNLQDAGTGLHRDLLQFYSPSPRPAFENVIVYGVKDVHNVAAQALFCSTGYLMENMAFVNYLASTNVAGQWRDSGKHVLFWNFTCVRPDAAASINTGGLLFRDLPVRAGQTLRRTNIPNLSMRNCVLQRMTVQSTGTTPSLANQSWADNMHYIDIRSTGAVWPGTNVTTSGSHSTLFRDPVHGDYRPRTGSILRGRVRQPFVPTDALGQPWQPVDAIGAAGIGD
jgi:hypothetical protein